MMTRRRWWMAALIGIALVLGILTQRGGVERELDGQVIAAIASTKKNKNFFEVTHIVTPYLERVEGSFEERLRKLGFEKHYIDSVFDKEMSDLDGDSLRRNKSLMMLYSRKSYSPIKLASHGHIDFFYWRIKIYADYNTDGKIEMTSHMSYMHPYP